ncbi:uncharacterized protein EAE97_003888 [Botrytis byssoidea]|uniref:2EXR domain-containing protein n=1 Tax=Botrytis byssoidea TaxID=139641 RepID=A0A9P5ISG6_9HELO|nr:uncharacterized protein EAE97_003888 [Botrytis byssoidea]KAF7948477.1 hypothetical protein EAE97_003888 [Botrytis byssoidea]
MASPVEDRGSIESTGCELPTTAILDHQVMANDEVKPVATQNKFQIKFTSINPVNLVGPDSGCNSNNDPTPSGKKELEAAYYSSKMFNFFETQLYRNGLLSTIGATASSDSFILFPLLPIELQRKIWFYALPPPDSNVWALFHVRYCQNNTKAAISIHCHSREISKPAFPFLYALQPVCRMAREMFLKHYSQFTFDGINNKNIRDPEDEDDNNYRLVTVIAKPGIWNMATSRSFSKRKTRISWKPSMRNLSRRNVSLLLTTTKLVVFSCLWRSSNFSWKLEGGPRYCQHAIVSFATFDTHDHQASVGSHFHLNFGEF